MRLRVDTVPLPIRPLYLAVSYALGGIYFALFYLLHHASRIEYVGGEHLGRSRPVILCLWHEDWWPYFTAFVRHDRPHVWINHPAAYMKPIHVALRMMGVERLILGSKGREGREAADRLVRCLRDGYSTTISPDGPHGPARLLRKGVLHVAAQSGLPIVPVTIEPSWALRLPTWDRKTLPLPLGRIEVRFGTPIEVDRECFDRAADRLRRALRPQEPSSQASAAARSS